MDARPTAQRNRRHARPDEIVTTNNARQIWSIFVLPLFGQSLTYTSLPGSTFASGNVWTYKQTTAIAQNHPLLTSGSWFGGRELCGSRRILNETAAASVPRGMRRQSRNCSVPGAHPGRASRLAANLYRAGVCARSSGGSAWFDLSSKIPKGAKLVSISLGRSLLETPQTQVL